MALHTRLIAKATPLPPEMVSGSVVVCVAPGIVMVWVEGGVPGVIVVPRTGASVPTARAETPKRFLSPIAPAKKPEAFLVNLTSTRVGSPPGGYGVWKQFALEESPLQYEMLTGPPFLLL
jgi:hypothetical protein